MYLEVSGVKKSYGEGGSYVQVLKGINTGVEKGQMCVIQGTSGSGKSTQATSLRTTDVIIWDLYSSSITLFQTSP